MIKDYQMLSGIQKVAVLFSVVGESLAMSLIKGLSKTEDWYLENETWLNNVTSGDYQNYYSNQ